MMSLLPDRARRSVPRGGFGENSEEAVMKAPATGNGFHHVAVRAMDFDATLRFYVEGLGFRVHFPFSVVGRIDRAAFLDAGDGRYVEVFGQGSAVQSEGRRRAPREEATEGAVLHFCLRAADTDASYARALAAGGVARVEPVTRRLSESPLVEVRIAFVTGPNGEVIEFLQSAQI
jgi:catechol 2,3-dioxygenase-like lactoylglutathione lyase family enzyme